MNTMTSTVSVSSLLVALVISGCSVSYKLRSPEQYRQDTRNLLESTESSFVNCYEGLLATDGDSSGTVVVSFDVEEETGKFAAVKSLPESTAPNGLQQCVVEGMDGLVLAPPDEKTGKGVMTFDFSQG